MEIFVLLFLIILSSWCCKVAMPEWNRVSHIVLSKVGQLLRLGPIKWKSLSCFWCEFGLTDWGIFGLWIGCLALVLLFFYYFMSWILYVVCISRCLLCPVILVCLSCHIWIVRDLFYGCWIVIVFVLILILCFVSFIDISILFCCVVPS